MKGPLVAIERVHHRSRRHPGSWVCRLACGHPAVVRLTVWTANAINAHHVEHRARCVTCAAINATATLTTRDDGVS